MSTSTSVRRRGAALLAIAAASGAGALSSSTLPGPRVRVGRPTPSSTDRRWGRAAALSLPRGGGASRLFSSNDAESAPDEVVDPAEVSTQKRRLTREFFSIAVPAFVQLAAEPLAGLVDTAYLGRLGPEVLGGAGVAISAQYAVSKLYNDPLLRTSISLVASEDGKGQQNGEEEGWRRSSREATPRTATAFGACSSATT